KTFGDSSTRNMIEYLAEDYGITRENQEGLKSQVGSRIEEAFGRTSQARIIQFNKKIFKQLLVRWIIISNISFRQVEISAFRVLLAYLCACVSFYFNISEFTFENLPKSGSTIRSWIMEYFINTQRIIKHSLSEARIVHFTF
ncbi:hypothetical protein L873DRAFT_1626539, partial [Choiromyces venosus 120613-1]